MLRDELGAVLVTADVLLVLASTVVVEAMVVGTPVVVGDSRYAAPGVRCVPATGEAVAAVAKRPAWPATASR